MSGVARTTSIRSDVDESFVVPADAGVLHDDRACEPVVVKAGSFTCRGPVRDRRGAAVLAVDVHVHRAAGGRGPVRGLDRGRDHGLGGPHHDSGRGHRRGGRPCRPPEPSCPSAGIVTVVPLGVAVDDERRAGRDGRRRRERDRGRAGGDGERAALDRGVAVGRAASPPRRSCSPGCPATSGSACSGENDTASPAAMDSGHAGRRRPGDASNARLERRRLVVAQVGEPAVACRPARCRWLVPALEGAEVVTARGQEGERADRVGAGRVERLPVDPHRGDARAQRAWVGSSVVLHVVGEAELQERPRRDRCRPRWSATAARGPA